MGVDQHTSFPLPNDFFSGGSHLTGPVGHLEDVLNQMYDEFSGGAVPAYLHAATETKAELQIYIDPVAGNDGNSGFSPVTPKKTLAAGIALLPNIIRHNTAIHLNGTFSDFGAELITCSLADGALLVIDGGAGLTQVAGPFTATAAGTTYLTVAGAGWTPDAWAGYLVEVTSGAQAGALCSIQGHTADTLTPCKNWSSSPGLASFRVVKPTTTLTASTALSSLSIKGCTGNGIIYLQRLCVEGSLMYLDASYNTCAGVRLSHQVNTGTYASGVVRALRTFDLLLGPFGVDPILFTSLATYGGASNVGASFVDAREILGFSIQASHHKDVRVSCSAIGAPYYGFARGARVVSARLADCRDALSGITPATSSVIENSSGYASTTFNGSSTSGLTLINSTVSVGGGVDFSDNTAHGIDAQQSAVEFRGAVVGSGNGGAGVYAHTRSSLLIKDGSPPTLTGTVGDFSVDGTTLGTRWNSVAIGSPFVDIPELTMVKEVP